MEQKERFSIIRKECFVVHDEKNDVDIDKFIDHDSDSEAYKLAIKEIDKCIEKDGKLYEEKSAIEVLN